MTPEVAAYLEKARRCLSYARINLDVDLGNDAGRNAYLAAFHAAQAFVFDRTGKATKSHQSLHAEFYRLEKEEPAIGIDIRRFLSQALMCRCQRNKEQVGLSLWLDGIFALEADIRSTLGTV